MGRLSKRYEENRGDTIIKAIKLLSKETLPQTIIDKLVYGASEEDIVTSGLEDTMRMAFQEILKCKEKYKLDNYRMAAYACALKKIERSY